MTAPRIDTWAAIDVMKALAPTPRPQPNYVPVQSLGPTVLRGGVIGHVAGFSMCSHLDSDALRP